MTSFDADDEGTGSGDEVDQFGGQNGDEDMLPVEGMEDGNHRQDEGGQSGNIVAHEENSSFTERSA